MNELQKLQADYRAGKIKKADYLEKLKALLEGDDITQAEHDEAAGFDPTDPDDKPVYSQNEVNRIIAKKARQEVKKALKAVGVELDPTQVNDKNLYEQVAQYVLAGQGKLPSESELQKQLKDANTKLAKVGNAENDIKRLTLENAVLKSASKYKPVNPAQVVRALGDYSDLIEYDDEGRLDAKSVDRAIKKIAAAEPNLFNANADDGEGSEGDGNNGGAGGFRGKGPGGGTPPAGKGDPKQLAAKKAEALAMLGIKTEGQK